MTVFIIFMVLLPVVLLICGFNYSSVYPTNEDVKVLNRCLKDVPQVDEVSKVKKELKQSLGQRKITEITNTNIAATPNININENVIRKS